MRTKLSTTSYLLALGLAIGLSLAAAQAQQNKSKAKTTTITGCLQKGDEANEFAITAEDGKKYELTSRQVALKDHVGHKVAVTGSLKQEDEDEANEGWAGQVQVTTLKMLSDSCK